MQDAQNTTWKAVSCEALLALALVAAAAPAQPANRPIGADAAPAAGVSVRLLPTAVVTAREVTLADVAELEGEGAQLAGAWPLGAAPAVGDSGVLELTQIQNMLARRGANLGRWIFRGSSRCIVKRVAGADAAQNPAGPAAAVPSSRPAAAPPDTLEATIREHLSARLAPLGGEAVVRFSPSIASALQLRRPQYEFRITDRGERVLGTVFLDVNVVENGTLRQTLPVAAEVSLRKNVVVAARPINRGEIIDRDRLTFEERSFDRPEDVPGTEPSQLIGQRSKRFVEARGLVSVRDVEPVPLVVRNDLVTVTVERGGMVIRAVAKAVSTGSIGESVVLKNEASRETFSAIVTGPKTAEVRIRATELAKGGA